MCARARTRYTLVSVPGDPLCSYREKTEIEVSVTRISFAHPWDWILYIFPAIWSRYVEL